MKISELASRAGVPVSAVKYYQREGLVPPGERSAPNQMAYGESHVQRVRLIRALLDTGGLSIAATRDVLRTLDTEGAPLAEAFEAAQHALGAAHGSEIAPAADSFARVRRLAESLGWHVSEDNPGMAVVARALDGLGEIDFDAPDDYLAAYASAAATAARADLAALATRNDPDRIAELMVVGTVLGDPLFAGLRRLAQEDATHTAFPVNRENP